MEVHSEVRHSGACISTTNNTNNSYLHIGFVFHFQFRQGDGIVLL
jgi:hypothetical protein